MHAIYTYTTFLQKKVLTNKNKDEINWRKVGLHSKWNKSLTNWPRLTQTDPNQPIKVDIFRNYIHLLKYESLNKKPDTAVFLKRHRQKMVFICVCIYQQTAILNHNLLPVFFVTSKSECKRQKRRKYARSILVKSTQIFIAFTIKVYILIKYINCFYAMPHVICILITNISWRKVKTTFKWTTIKMLKLLNC